MDKLAYFRKEGEAELPVCQGAAASWWRLTLQRTLISACIFSTLFSIHFLWWWWGEFATQLSLCYLFISMYILHTVLHTFSMVTMRRICYTIKPLLLVYQHVYSPHRFSIHFLWLRWGEFATQLSLCYLFISMYILHTVLHPFSMVSSVTIRRN